MSDTGLFKFDQSPTLGIGLQVVNVDFNFAFIFLDFIDPVAQSVADFATQRRDGVWRFDAPSNHVENTNGFTINELADTWQIINSPANNIAANQYKFRNPQAISSTGFIVAQLGRASATFGDFWYRDVAGISVGDTLSFTET